MPEYDFGTQLRRGERAERELDRMFGERFEIRDATRDEQRRGIDRWFTDPAGRRQAVEYKADWTAHRTGRVFVETISVDTDGKPGWAYTSEAEWLLYYLPIDGLVYVIEMSVLRRRLPRWLREYPTRRIPNRGYHTVGLLVAQVGGVREAV